ncbi:MAG: hypothetical protein QOG97_678 [Acidimicrobiaceae bacterium]|nr:hypothetical protein [Acidimicrobiaceae bacterium]
MGVVWRVLVGVALGGWWLILLAGPASAHPGIENPYVPAHVVTTVALGVPSEEPSPMVEIDVVLPPDFTLQGVDSVPGWQQESGAGRLRYFNGNIPQGGYAQFTFSGTFAHKRVVELPVTTRAADGTTVVWDQAQGAAHPAALALPGYPRGSLPPAAGVSASGAGRSPGPLLEVGLVAAGAGAVGLGVAANRRRRGGSKLVAGPAEP